MNKGDKARVIRDCAVKAGSEVEITGTWEAKAPRFIQMYECYLNNIRVEIAESDLEVIKEKRWLPKDGVMYWYPDPLLDESKTDEWCVTTSDRRRRRTVGAYRTKEESDAMLAKIQALVNSEIGDC